MLVNSRQILLDAKQGGYAVPAPDYLDLDSARVFVEVAQRLCKPLILSYPEVLNGALPLEEAAVIGKLLAGSTKTPVALHLDHGEHLDFICKAIDLGFTSVMIDASMDSFAENVRKTREVVAYAHKHDVTVEAEIGHVGHGENPAEVGESETIYTTVHEAADFVAQTGVDSLAVSIGTIHGIYKNLAAPCLNFERLAELSRAVSVPLVLHGGSGSGEENLHRCASDGISKINIFTDFLTAAMDGIRTEAPVNYPALKKTANEAMAHVLEYYYRVFSAE